MESRCGYMQTYDFYRALRDLSLARTLAYMLSLEESTVINQKRSYSDPSVLHSQKQSNANYSGFQSQ